MESDGAVDAAIAAVLDSEAVRARRVLGVWLFGSRAAGRPGPTSDVDLALLADPPLDLDARARLMDRAGLAADRDVDVVDLASAPPALAWEVVTSGRLVVERDERAVEELVRRARFAAEDAAQRDRMVLLAQVGRVGDRAQ